MDNAIGIQGALEAMEHPLIGVSVRCGPSCAGGLNRDPER
jgi:hypothetical protein